MLHWKQHGEISPVAWRTGGVSGSSAEYLARTEALPRGEIAAMALKSMSRLTSIFLALFMLLSIGLVYWQIIQPTPLATFTYSPDFCASNNQPVRGRILDRNGVVLATSEYDPKAPCNYRRHYCVPSLSPLLGYFSYLFQSGGLEDVYDNYLTG
jgi:hypothetical protein